MPSFRTAQDYGWVDEARAQQHDAVLQPRKGQKVSVRVPEAPEQVAQQATTADFAEQPGAQLATSVEQAEQPQAQLAAPRDTAEQTDFWKLLAAQHKDDVEGILAVCEVLLAQGLIACFSMYGLGFTDHSDTDGSHVKQGAHISPAQAAMALRKAAKAVQRLSSPLRIMQAWLALAHVCNLIWCNQLLLTTPSAAGT